MASRKFFWAGGRRLIRRLGGQPAISMHLEDMTIWQYIDASIFNSISNNTVFYIEDTTIKSYDRCDTEVPETWMGRHELQIHLSVLTHINCSNTAQISLAATSKNLLVVHKNRYQNNVTN